IVDSGQTLVLDTSGGARLAEQTGFVDEAFIARLAQNLERDVAIEHHVVREIDVAHASVADLLLDPIARRPKLVGFDVRTRAASNRLRLGEAMQRLHLGRAERSVFLVALGSHEFSYSDPRGDRSDIADATFTRMARKRWRSRAASRETACGSDSFSSRN